MTGHGSACVREEESLCGGPLAEPPALYSACMRVKSLQSCPTLRPQGQGSPSMEFFPGKNTGVVAISSFRGSSQPRDQTHISWISCAGRQNSLPLSPPYWLLLRYLVKQKMNLGWELPAQVPINDKWPEDSYMCPEGNLISCNHRVRWLKTKCRISSCDWG